MNERKNSDGKVQSKSIQKDSHQHASLATFNLEDNRPEHITQLKWRDNLNSSSLTNNLPSPAINNGVSSIQLKSLSKNSTLQAKEGGQLSNTKPSYSSLQMKSNHPERKGKNQPLKGEVSFTDNRVSAVQLKPRSNPAAMAGNVAQLKEVGQVAEKILIEQSIGMSHTPTQLVSSGVNGSTSSTQLKSNNSGLPAKLKSGIENLSGQSMHDVTVHKNSNKPAQLNAHAYAQGTNIHVAPGQEKHLPHEAWHVAQQKQGRVKPTRQLKGKVAINDDSGLEQEADTMGRKALEVGQNSYQPLLNEPAAEGGGQFKLKDAGSSFFEKRMGSGSNGQGSISSNNSPFQLKWYDFIPNPFSSKKETPQPKPQAPAKGAVAATPASVSPATPESATKLATEGTTDKSATPIEKAGPTAVTAEPSANDSPESVTEGTTDKTAEAVEKAAKSETSPSESYTQKGFLILKDSLRDIEGIQTAYKNISVASEATKTLAKSQPETTSKDKTSEADQEKAINEVLSSGKFEEEPEKIRGFTDTIKSMVGWGKKDVRLKPDMDPRKKAYGFKFGIPVKVNVADNTSKTWKPVQIDRESAKIHSLPFISEIPETLSTGYYPLSKMTLIDIDLNEGHAVKLTGNKPKAAPDNQTTKEAAPASSKALNLDEPTSSSTTPATSDKAAVSKENIGAGDATPAVDKDPKKKDKSFAEKAMGVAASAGNLAKAAYSGLTSFESVANYGNEQLEKGTESISGLLDKALSYAKEVPILQNLALSMPSGGTRIVPGVGTIFTFKSSYNFGTKDSPNTFDISPTIRVNTAKRDDWSVDYLGTSVKFPNFTIGNEDTVKISVAPGNLVHSAKDALANSYFTATNLSVNVKALGQDVGVKIEEATFDTVTNKSNIKVGEVSADLDILGTKMAFKVAKPTFDSGVLDFESAKGSISTPIAPFTGLSFSNVSLELGKNDTEGKNLSGGGDFDVNTENVKGSGSIQATKNGKAPAILKLVNGNLSANILNQQLSLQGVNYDSGEADKALTIDESALAINITNPLDGKAIVGSFGLNNANISEAGFSFTEASANFDRVGITDTIGFEAITATLTPLGKTFTFSGSGEFKGAHGPVTEALGTVSVDKNEAGITEYKLSNGSIKGIIAGANFGVENLRYSSLDNTVRADWAGLPIDYFGEGNTIKVGLENITLNGKDGFNFSAATVQFPDYQITDDTSIKGIKGGIKIDEENKTDETKKWIYFAEAELQTTNGQQVADGVTIKSAKGKFNITKRTGEAFPQFQFLEGGFGIDVMGSSLDVEGLKYDNGVLSGEKANILINAPELSSKTHQVEINQFAFSRADGFTFQEAAVTNITDKLDLGPLSIAPSKVALSKTPGSLMLSATGKVGLVDIFPGVIPDINATGTIGYDFVKEESEVGVAEAGMKLGIPNPLSSIQLPQAIPGIGSVWPLGMTTNIPVAPGVFIDIGFEFGGGVRFSDSLSITLGYNNGALTVDGAMDILPSLHFSIIASATAGLPGVIGLTAGLKGKGAVDATITTHLTGSFDLGIGEMPAADKEFSAENSKKGNGFSYEGGGDITLALIAFAKGYVFTYKKEYEKNLVEKNVGKFSLEPGKGIAFEKSKEPVMSEAEKAELESEAKKPEAEARSQEAILADASGGKKLTKEQILEARYAVDDDKTTGETIANAGGRLLAGAKSLMPGSRSKKTAVPEPEPETEPVAAVSPEEAEQEKKEKIKTDLKFISELNYERINWQGLTKLKTIEIFDGDEEVMETQKQGVFGFRKEVEVSVKTPEFIAYEKKTKEQTKKNWDIIFGGINTKSVLITTYENILKRSKTITDDKPLAESLVHHESLITGYKSVNEKKSEDLRSNFMPDMLFTRVQNWRNSIKESEEIVNEILGLTRTIPDQYQKVNEEKAIFTDGRQQTEAVEEVTSANSEKRKALEAENVENKKKGLVKYKGRWMTEAEAESAKQKKAVNAAASPEDKEARQKAEQKDKEERQKAKQEANAKKRKEAEEAANQAGAQKGKPDATTAAAEVPAGSVPEQTPLAKV